MTARVQLQALLDDVEVLDALSDAECSDLYAMVVTARERERAALDESINSVLSALPWPIRVPAKKIMFGGRR